MPGKIVVPWSAAFRVMIPSRGETTRACPATAEARGRAWAVRWLKAKGFKFVGPVIVYAWMQACGLVNDHLVGCPRHAACERAGKRFRAPA